MLKYSNIILFFHAIAIIPMQAFLLRSNYGIHLSPLFILTAVTEGENVTVRTHAGDCLLWVHSVDSG